MKKDFEKKIIHNVKVKQIIETDDNTLIIYVI